MNQHNLEYACANFLLANLSELEIKKLLSKTNKHKTTNGFNLLVSNIQQEQKRLKNIADAEHHNNAVRTYLNVNYLKDLIDQGGKNERH